MRHPHQHNSIGELIRMLKVQDVMTKPSEIRPPPYFFELKVEAHALIYLRLSKSTGCGSEGFAKQQLIGNVSGLSLVLLLRTVTWRTLWPNSSRHFRISANCSLVTLESFSGLDMVGIVENSRKPSCFE